MLARRTTCRLRVMECMARPAKDIYAGYMPEPLSPPGASFPHSATWRVRQPSALVTHVLEVHHEPTRAMLTKIERLLACVTDAFCVRPPLPEIAAEFARLRDALIEHLDVEERDVFGAITSLENRSLVHVSRAIARANQEHMALHLEVERLRARADELRVMDDTCRALRALEGALADLERELHSHFQLESEVLFPRAEELERTVREESRR